MSQEPIINRENDEAELEQLYHKKYGGLLNLTEEDILSIKTLELRKFGNNGYAVYTPSRPTFSSENNSQFSGSSSSMSTSTVLSKASNSLAKILNENRLYKSRFAETRITDVEEEIFSMDKDFHNAAEYHAPFLLFMKYFF
jgi:hypothetical protein